jgi:predicted nucleotidyltransferase
MPSVIAPLPEQAVPRGVPAPHDDPLGHVLADAPGFAPPRALVEAVTQNVLRGLLAGFLHEPPLAHWYRNAYTIAGQTLAFHDVLGRLLPRLSGTTPADCEIFARAPSAAALGDWVAALYRLCRRVLPPADLPELEAPVPQARISCRLPWAVRRLAREMAGHLGLQLYLHGSLATCDATAYSDVDTLLVISHEWLESQERINELRQIVSHAQRWLYVYDPLQHHGFMLVTALDLTRYARYYYPLELLSYAFALAGNDIVRYRVRESDEETVSVLRRLCAKLDRLDVGSAANPDTRFALKLALSEMMLLPTYSLQVSHRVLYKRESFEAVRVELSPRACEAMDALTAWRKEWRLTPLERTCRLLGPRWAEPLARRASVRARNARVTRHDRERWRNILPAARQMALEILRRADAA